MRHTAVYSPNFSYVGISWLNCQGVTATLEITHTQTHVNKKTSLTCFDQRLHIYCLQE